MINRREEIISEVELQTFRKLNLGYGVRGKVNAATEELIRNTEDLVTGAIRGYIQRQLREELS